MPVFCSGMSAFLIGYYLSPLFDTLLEETADRPIGYAVLVASLVEEVLKSLCSKKTYVPFFNPTKVPNRGLLR